VVADGEDKMNGEDDNEDGDSDDDSSADRGRKRSSLERGSIMPFLKPADLSWELSSIHLAHQCSRCPMAFGTAGGLATHSLLDHYHIAKRNKAQ